MTQENLKHHNQARERSMPSNIKKSFDLRHPVNLLPKNLSAQGSEGSDLLGVYQAAPESPPRWRSKGATWLAGRRTCFIHVKKALAYLPLSVQRHPMVL